MEKHIKAPFLGTLKQQFKYKSYSPPKIERPFRWKDEKIDVLLEEAVRLLGELNVYSKLVPDVDFFIRMHIVKEAASSSRIEGTKTGIEEAILSKDEVRPEERDDWEEVQNYIKSMNYAISKLDRFPISIRLIKKIHEVLLSGVRGEYKQPGEIRVSQNWIGGTNPNDAFFVPPHHGEVPDLLSDLEKYWHNENLDIPILIKVAVSHYQFETIHPFLDGNGRVGRLLIVLQLISKRYLQKPTLYISDFFEKNRNVYYDALSQVRITGEVDRWIKFFLNAVIKTSEKGIETFDQIIKLKKTYDKKILSLGGKAEKASKLVEIMYSKPKMNVNEASEVLGVSYVTANELVNDLKRLNLLKESTGYSRNRAYVLYEYLGLFKK